MWPLSYWDFTYFCAQLVNNAEESVLKFFFKTFSKIWTSMVYIYVFFESSEISAHENDNAYGKEHMVIIGLKRYVAKHYIGMSLVSRRMIS